MKIRFSEFKSLAMSDAAKITYFELLLNDLTHCYFDDFCQDVMTMTTRDWLSTPFRITLKVILMPLATYFEYKDIKYYSKFENSLDFVTYSRFKLYWRGFDDFETKPYRWET